MTLRIYDDGPSAATPGPPARKKAPPGEPLPLLIRLTEHEGRDGPFVHVSRAWNNEDGARCRACPVEDCNFIAEAGGVGSCWTRRPGKLADADRAIAPPG